MHRNVTLWRVHVTNVTVETQQCILCFCTLSYKWQGCWEAFTGDKIRALIFSTTFVLNISYFRKTSQT